jgi:hypothetical protein
VPLYHILSGVRQLPPVLLMLSLFMACASTPEPGVAGIYASWDDVITRWIGQLIDALYYELGRPNLHAVQLTGNQTDLVGHDDRSDAGTSE